MTVCHVDRAAVPVRLAAARRPDLRTEHFEVHRNGQRLLVLHRTRPDELDDDIGGLVAGELSPVISAGEDFERIVTGIIRSTVGDALTAWSTFYANTMAVLRDPGPVPDGVPPESSLAAFAPVHDRAVREVVGTTVLDVGACFGFLPLRLVDEGFRVIASDHAAGTMSLLAAIARHQGRPLPTLVCDARAVPLASSSVDTVTAVHVLEHLGEDATETLLAEACRVARRRVVVAVPYEDVPDLVYGHLRRFDHDVLAGLGVASEYRWRVEDHHGGWLVLDL